jgi:hypothetical protein
MSDCHPRVRRKRTLGTLWDRLLSSLAMKIHHPHVLLIFSRKSLLQIIPWRSSSLHTRIWYVSNEGSIIRAGQAIVTLHGKKLSKLHSRKTKLHRYLLEPAFERSMTVISLSTRMPCKGISSPLPSSLSPCDKLSTVYWYALTSGRNPAWSRPERVESFSSGSR